MLIIPAAIIYLLITFPSGSYYCYQDKCGIYFWGVHGHDAIWHLALVANAFKKFPFISPTYAGARLTGYNYLYDFIIYLLAKIGISPLFSYFKLIPSLWFLLFTYLLIILGRKIKNNPVFIGLLLFFVYFAGSFSYFFTLYREKTIWGSSGYLSQMLWHTMLNPQFALSLLPILVILIKIKEKKIDLNTCLLFGIFIFINMGLKFYGGIITGFLVFIYFFLNLIRGEIKLFKFLLFSLVISFFFGLSLLIFYDPFSSVKTGSIFALAPFALVHPLTEDSSLFYLRDLTDARYFLQAHGIGRRLIAIESLNLFIFLFFYLGVRFFGMVYLVVKALRKKMNTFDLIIGLTFLCSVTITVLFVQKAEWWNTIQFFYYGIFLSVFYIAELSYALIRKKHAIFYLIVMLFIMLALPTTFDIIKSSAYFPGSSYLPKDEIEALEFLKKQPEGVVYSPIFNKKLAEAYSAPYPLYAYGDTAYVSAFSGKRQYLADIVQLRLTSVDYEKRLEKINKADCGMVGEIDYVYQSSSYKMNRKLMDCGYKMEIIFGNTLTTIYKVIK